MQLNQLESKFFAICAEILGGNYPKKIAVALSGGIDSMALTMLLKKLALSKNIQLFCLIIDHKLRASSGDEAKQAAEILAQNSLAGFILESYLPVAPEANIEAQAREVRYSLLKEFCRQNDIGHLFIAHHSDDLAENFLIRLFRGSGIDGLAALDYISDFQGLKLVRPLLDFNKEELQNYLQESQIPWIEDPSNQQEKYLRNKIRQFLRSLDDYKNINQRIASASQAILASKKLLEDDMIANADKILKFALGYFLLNLDNFKALPQQKAWRYLAWALMEVGGNYYKPRLAELKNLYCWIISDLKHQPRSFYGCIIEKYHDQQLLIYREKSAIQAAKLTNNMVWDRRFLINIEPGFDSQAISVETISSRELNNLLKEFKPEKLKNLKNPLKKIFYNLPVFKKAGNIIAFPHIGFSSGELVGIQLQIQFKNKTRLLENENCALPD